MKTKFTSLLLIFSMLTALSARGTNYVNNGTSTAYVLYTGDSLYIAGGTYTGTIVNWQPGAKIAVAAGATFKPSSFSYFPGKIYVSGTATLNSLDGQTSSFLLQNWGVVTVSGNVSLSNSAQFVNNYGGTITVNGSFQANSSTITNQGTMTVKSDFYVGTSSTFTNNNLFTAQGKLEINSSTGVNGGKLYTQKQLTLSGATMTNTCRMIADGTMNFSTSTVTNTGLIWATTASNNSAITNSSTITSKTAGKIKAVSFNNSGTINGTGYIYLIGTTASSGIVGASGTTSDTLWIYDVSRTNSRTIFDSQSGTVYNNAKYQSFTAPDTIFVYPTCSAQYASMMASLPVQFESFAAKAVDETAVITWTAEQDPGTAFEVQRSYDAVSFSPISVIQADNGQKSFVYVDEKPGASTVYYRIRAIEATGSTHLTDNRLVRFATGQAISLRAWPNPFTTNLTVAFESPRQQQVKIRVVNLAGQEQLVKNFSAAPGSNRVNLPEAIGWPRGVFVMQVSAEQGLLATEKIVKQ